MATASQQRDGAALVERYSQTAGQHDAATMAAIWAAYQVVEDWWNPTQTVTAAKNAAQIATASQLRNRGLVAEFIAMWVAVITGKRPPTSSSRTNITYARDADPIQVYSRPVFAYRDAVADGKPADVALLEARSRADVISLTDAMLARRASALAAMENVTTSRGGKVTTYRRIIHPERSKTGTCGLCVSAATRVYHVEDLLPIHSRCQCGVLPILGEMDPGQYNVDDLLKVYEATPGTRRQELSRTRYTADDLEQIIKDGNLGQASNVVDLDEIGPTLVPKSSKPQPSAQTRARAELAALKASLSALEKRAANGEDVSAPMEWQRARIVRLRQIASAAA